MGRLGIGAMIHHLSGGTEHSASEYFGKKITDVRLVTDKDHKRETQDTLEIDFEDGKKIDIWDDGQSCCEHRYLRTDDEIKDLVGATLKDVIVKDADVPQNDDDYSDCHEAVFIELVTDKGSVTFSAHNEHNGYYGGFGLTITERE